MTDRPMTDEDELQTRFARFDSDKNGYIDEAEFADLVSALGAGLSRDEIAVAFLAIDTNGNQRIEFGEFSSWWRKYHAR